MKILLLSDINSTHTRKWAVSLAEKGFVVGVFSLRKPDGDWFKEKNISVFTVNTDKKKFYASSFSKLSYLKVVPRIKKIIKEFKPDVVHAHYATSYGLLGQLSGFHPLFISCWGSDVMDFPKKSFVHKFILKRILSKADKILATSKTIEKYIHEIIKRNVVITPFGVNTELFKPMKVKSVFNENDIVIGTIKSLEKVYCIDLLIEAFAKIKNEYKNAKLLIVGEGTQRKKLELCTMDFGITEKEIYFAGKIDHTEIPSYHNMIDIFVNISEYESFGVSVIESMACGKPVIVTNTGGLSEIVENDSLGLKIPIRDVDALASKLQYLLKEKEIRETIGISARKHIQKKYEWNKNVEQMITVYNKF